MHKVLDMKFLVEDIYKAKTSRSNSKTFFSTISIFLTEY